MKEIDFRSVEPKRAFSLYVSRNEHIGMNIEMIMINDDDKFEYDNEI